MRRSHPQAESNMGRRASLRPGTPLSRKRERQRKAMAGLRVFRMFIELEQAKVASMLACSAGGFAVEGL